MSEGTEGQHDPPTQAQAAARRALGSLPLGDTEFKAFAAGWTAAGGDADVRHVPLLPQGGHMVNPPMIYGQLAKVMQAVLAVGKDGLYDQGGTRYNFRGIDAVVNAVGPALRKHAVVVIPEVMQVGYRDAMTTGQTPRPTREVTVQARYTFYAEDGSSVSAIVPGESLDQSDKGSAKAMSVAFRIALLQVFALPTSEPDPDASYHTRDGAGAMGEATKRLLLAAVPEASIPEMDAMWAVALEHSAAERAIGEATTTWADYFAQRLAEIIADIRNAEEGQATYQELKESPLAHLRFQDKPISLLMRERAQAIMQRAAAAYDAAVANITGATSLEDLETAHQAMGRDAEASVISAAQHDELRVLANDKLAKLERERNEAALEPSGSEL